MVDVRITSGAKRFLSKTKALGEKVKKFRTGARTLRAKIRTFGTKARKAGTRVSSMLRRKPKPIFERKIPEELLDGLQYDSKTCCYTVVGELFGPRLEFMLLSDGKIDPYRVKVNGKFVKSDEAARRLAFLFRDLYEEQRRKK